MAKNIIGKIQARLVRGEPPAQIAKSLGVPLHWVTEAEMDMDVVPWAVFALHELQELTNGGVPTKTIK